MEDTLKFIDDVIAEYNERMKSQPYQINLLEEVHMHDNGQRKDLSGAKKKICENAHTRILERILRFQNQEGYIFLKSLIDYIQEKSRSESWSNIRIETPLFESEFNCDKTSGRIDLLIWEEGKYAIIFENKINEAGDQSNQLARYISHLCQSGFSEEQVFVLYLSAEGIEKEFKQTWQLDGADYKESFVPRFFDLSYRYDILPWLNDKIVSSLDSLSGQLNLESAIKQYVDYLKGKFGLRENEIQIINEILETTVVGNSLNSKLQWLDMRIEAISQHITILKKKADSSNDYSSELRRARLVQEGLYSVKTKIIQQEVGNKSFPSYEKHTIYYDRICHFGYVVTIHERQYLLYIYQKKQKTSQKNNHRFGASVISIPIKGERIDDVARRVFARLDSKSKDDWMISYFPLGDYEAAINKIKQVLCDVQKYIESNA